MTNIYVDATTLIALGSIGELDRLTGFEGQLVVVPEIESEVTTQPAKANLEQIISKGEVTQPSDAVAEAALDRAMELLGDRESTGDVRLIAHLLAGPSADRSVALISDDRRLRTVSRGLGIQVTGTIGVVIRAVGDRLDPDEAKALVRRLDSQGLHLTGELRETAFDLIEDAPR